MGTWGPGPFDSDLAEDFVDQDQGRWKIGGPLAV